MNDSMENLLSRFDNINRPKNMPSNSIDKKDRHRADKSANIDDFISMVNILVTKGMRDDNVYFCPDESRPINPEDKLDQTHITYKVIERVPSNEIKPRVRETITDTETRSIGDIYGQTFKCIIQFDIFDEKSKKATNIMNKLEELIFKYTSFLKKNGVKEVLLKRQFSDSTYDPARQYLSIRNIQYYVEIEKITVIFKEEIQEIELEAEKALNQ